MYSLNEQVGNFILTLEKGGYDLFPYLPNNKWKEGDPITKGQVKFILKNWDKKDPDEFYIRAMINKAFELNLFSAGVTNTAVRKVTSGGSGLDIIQILFSPKIEVNPS